MKKPLELTVYPKVDRWVPWSIENYKGETVTGSRREYGYETPQGVFQGDEFPEKRLTDAELAAEYWAADVTFHRNIWQEMSRGEDWPDETWNRIADPVNILHRFATLPHYDEQP